ncbi:unnamed protein product [Musa textilis]
MAGFLPTLCKSFHELEDGYFVNPPTTATSSSSPTPPRPPSTDVNGKHVAATEAAGGGYVKGVVTYMVMDNVAVMPVSTISAVSLLNRFHVTDLKSLSEW